MSTQLNRKTYFDQIFHLHSSALVNTVVSQQECAEFRFKGWLGPFCGEFACSPPVYAGSPWVLQPPLLKYPPQSSDLNPIECLWDVVKQEIHYMDVQATNLQALCDGIVSIWTKICEECFQHHKLKQLFQPLTLRWKHFLFNFH